MPNGIPSVQCDRSGHSYKAVAATGRHWRREASAVPSARGKTRGHEAPFDAALADKLIHLPQHFGGLKFLRCQAAHDADRNGAIERAAVPFPLTSPSAMPSCCGP